MLHEGKVVIRDDVGVTVSAAVGALNGLPPVAAALQLAAKAGAVLTAPGACTTDVWRETTAMGRALSVEMYAIAPGVISCCVWYELRRMSPFRRNTDT